MIAGATRGAGGGALGAHVASIKGGQDVRMGASRGLVSDTIRDQVAELTDIVSHSRARRPIYHVHADPPPEVVFDQTAWDRYWIRFEAEFDLEGQPFAEQIHVKADREHRHREYSLVRSDGTTMPLSHDHARREKIGRITELEEGQRLTPGAHNRAVLTALDREGRADVAQAIRAAGLDKMARPRASKTPAQRAQAERTHVDPAHVSTAVLEAWAVSDSGQAFASALSDRGLRLARGNKVAVIVDSAGGIHPLARMLGNGSKTSGGTRIGAGEVRARIAGINLSSVTEVAPPPEVQAIPNDTIITPDPITFPGEQHADIPIALDASGQAADLVRQPHLRADRGHDVGRQDPVGPPIPGLAGHGSDVVCGASYGEADGVPDRAPHPPGPAGEGGADANRPGPPAARGNREIPDPDGSAHGRHRIQARRILRGINAAARFRESSLTKLIGELRRPLTADRMFLDAMAASDARAAAVLAGEPWQDARARDATLIAVDMHEDRMAVVRAADFRADAAQTEAEAAGRRVGFLDRLAARLGVRTAAVRDVDEAQARAAQAEAARPCGHELRKELARFDSHARVVVRGREAERSTWSRKPDVVAAHLVLHGNDLVRAAIAGGDRGVGHLAAADLKAARKEVLSRESEKIRLQHAVERRDEVSAIQPHRQAASMSSDQPGPGRP